MSYLPPKYSTNFFHVKKEFRVITDNLKSEVNICEKSEVYVYMENIAIRELPINIESNLSNVLRQVEKIEEHVNSLINEDMEESVSFQFKHQAPSDILSNYERAQAICFITRYENLPVLQNFNIINEGSKYFFENLGEMRHIINEYRTIIQNKKDSIFYNHIHVFCFMKLTNNNPKQDLSIKVISTSGEDKTPIMIKMLNDRHKAIKSIIDKSDFDYLYNGILQHSDHRFTSKFLEQYHSGELNYIYLKHALLLTIVKDLLSLHYQILNFITFPKMGAL